MGLLNRPRPEMITFKEASTNKRYTIPISVFSYMSDHTENKNLTVLLLNNTMLTINCNLKVINAKLKKCELLICDLDTE